MRTEISEPSVMGQASILDAYLQTKKINPEEEISIGQAAELFRDLEPQLVDGIRRHWWYCIKTTAAHSRKMDYEGPNYRIIQDRPEPKHDDDQYRDNYHFACRFVISLGPDQTTTGKTHMSTNRPQIQFKFFFSDEEKGREAWAGWHANEFTTLDEMDYGGARLFYYQPPEGADWSEMMHDRCAQRLDPQGTINIQDVNAISAKYPDLKVKVADFKGLLNTILEPDEEYPEALARLQELAAKYNCPAGEVEALCQTITSFGNRYHQRNVPVETMQGSVGSCNGISLEFTSHVERQRRILFKSIPEIDLKLKYYNGGPIVPDSHTIVVYKDNIIIDWTARQFPEIRAGEYPYPLIYDAGELRHLFGPGPDEKCTTTYPEYIDVGF